jgi:antitoxin ParD1/3/4
MGRRYTQIKSLMEVHLTAEMEWLVASKMQSGRYRSATDVVNEALRMMEERDAFNHIGKEEVASRIGEGLTSLKLGEGVDADTVFERLDAELDEIERLGHR